MIRDNGVRVEVARVSGGNSMVMDVATQGLTNGWGLATRLALADGSLGHPHCRRLATRPAPLRDLGDVLHALCAVHGDHPGMADEARAEPVPPAAADWLASIADGFAVERGYLARLVAAAGPLPSTPGQAATEATLVTQRHALGRLARSERVGCTVGSIAALVLDWQAIREVLDVAAARFGVEVAANGFPPPDASTAAVEQLAVSPAAERAMAFGAQQLLAQHRGLWDLLEARASARG